jgi:asparagine synthase (glutamine-hydrolysing)
MSRFMPEGFKTFSVGFSQDKYYNELPYARIVAERFGTKHYEYVVNPDIVQILPKMVSFFDEPFAVSSALPTYLLAQLARNEVKVVLTGDGADELIAGYNYRYMAVKYSPLFDKIPLLKSNSARSLLAKLMRDKNSKVNKFYAHINVPYNMRYFRYLSKFQEEEKQSLYSAELRRRAAENDSSRLFMSYYEKCPDKDRLNKWLYVDFKTSLPDEMLTKVDRMTMAFGLEARVPFLDHLLAEYLCGLPSDLKLRRMTSKYLLRKAIKDLLPKEITERPKHGFEVPLDDWMRGELKDYVRDYLNEKRIKKEGFFEWESVKRILDLHSANKFNYGHQIWMLLTFGIWHEQYFN